MSDLRERVDAEGRRLWGYAEVQFREKYGVPKESSIKASTDRAIAAFEAALLSDEVVEAAARKLLHYQQNSMPGPGVTEDYVWDVQFEDGREESRQMPRMPCKPR